MLRTALQRTFDVSNPRADIPGNLLVNDLDQACSGGAGKRSGRSEWCHPAFQVPGSPAAADGVHPENSDARRAHRSLSALIDLAQASACKSKECRRADHQHAQG